MKTERVTDIGVRLDTDSSCNNRRVTACCFDAIQEATAMLTHGSNEVVSAELTVFCPGYNAERGGYQARVSGKLLDVAGLTIVGVNTTAQELNRAADAIATENANQ